MIYNAAITLHCTKYKNAIYSEVFPKCADMIFNLSCLVLSLVFQYCSTQSISSYYKTVESHRLEATAISTIKVESDLECFLRCNRLVAECKSFNLAVTANEDGFYNCVLLDASAPNEMKAPLVRSLGYNHYTKMVG